jgi:hypothetical protein
VKGSSGHRMLSGRRTSLTGIWHIPLQSRGHSGAVTQNFLWQEGPVYIMDNHRAAWWCWLRHFDASEPFDLFHIDRHTDTLTSNLDVWLDHLPTQMRGMNLQQYLDFSVLMNGTDCPVVRWDNYLSLFLAQEKQSLRSLYFATHNDGDAPNVPEGFCRHVDVWNLPGNFKYWLDNGDSWIVNIDIDYFFCPFGHGNHRRFLSKDFVTAMCEPIKAHLETGRIKVLTICLTPDEGGFSGGWAESEEVCAEICGQLKIDFSLP